ncbi:MAG: 50S ribosomal protein L24 [Minisyncoccia bacterium]
MKIKKNDTVIVICGKNKGKTAKVLKAFPAKNKVLVEGVNTVKKRQHASKSNQKGQTVEKPMPIDVSNVMLLEGGKRVRAAKKEIGGKMLRVSAKTGKEI